MAKHSPEIVVNDAEPPAAHSFGYRLRAERKRLRLPAVQAAELIGITTTILAQWEASEYGTLTRAMSALARAGADVTFIVGGIRHDASGIQGSAADVFNKALDALARDERQRLLLHLVSRELRNTLPENQLIGL